MHCYRTLLPLETVGVKGNQIPRNSRHRRNGGYFVLAAADFADAVAALFAINWKPVCCACLRTSASMLIPAAALPDAISTSPSASCASS